MTFKSSTLNILGNALKSRVAAQNIFDVISQNEFNIIKLESFVKVTDVENCLRFNDLDYICLNTSSLTFNPISSDIDFIINKNTTGEAFKYDAGLDQITINSETIIDSVAVRPNVTGNSFIGTTGARFSEGNFEDWVAVGDANFGLTDLSVLYQKSLYFWDGSASVEGSIQLDGTGKLLIAGDNEIRSNSRHEFNGTVLDYLLTSVTETINVSNTDVIIQTASGITSSLSNFTDGQVVTIKNSSTGDTTLNLTVDGIVNPILSSRDALKMIYVSTEWKAI